jgi:hypothetical protein
MLVSLRVSDDRTISVNPAMVAYVGDSVHDGQGRPLSRVVFGLRDRNGDPCSEVVQGTVEQITKLLNAGSKGKASSAKKS